MIAAIPCLIPCIICIVVGVLGGLAISIWLLDGVDYVRMRRK